MNRSIRTMAIAAMAASIIHEDRTDIVHQDVSVSPTEHRHYANYGRQPRHVANDGARKLAHKTRKVRLR